MDDTIRTKAINYSRGHLKELAAYAIAIGSSIITLSVAYGHKQAATEADNVKVIEKLDAAAADLKSMKSTLESHGERMAALEATSRMTQSDVHDLKSLADQAQHVADTFKVPRLTPQGHRAKH